MALQVPASRSSSCGSLVRSRMLHALLVAPRPEAMLLLGLVGMMNVALAASAGDLAVPRAAIRVVGVLHGPIRRRLRAVFVACAGTAPTGRFRVLGAHD